MFHTERDAATFFAEVLLVVGTGAGALYAATVSCALVFRAFGSARALSTSLVLSAIASIPLPFALVLQWPYLPAEWDINPLTAGLSLLDGLLVAFVWAAPVIQYRLLRRKARAPAGSDG